MISNDYNQPILFKDNADINKKVNDTFLMTEIKFSLQNVISLTVMLYLLGCASKQDKLSAVKKAKMKSFEDSFRTDTSFSKATMVMRFPARRLPKYTARFNTEKIWHSPPSVELPWDFPPPPPQSLRADGHLR